MLVRVPAISSLLASPFSITFSLEYSAVTIITKIQKFMTLKISILKIKGKLNYSSIRFSDNIYMYMDQKV
jgi:hypothetical protein